MVPNITSFSTVCDDHMFKDEILFYRFRRDDNSLIFNHELELLLKGSDIYHRCGLLLVDLLIHLLFQITSLGEIPLYTRSPHLGRFPCTPDHLTWGDFPVHQITSLEEIPLYTRSPHLGRFPYTTDLGRFPCAVAFGYFVLLAHRV